MLTAAGDPLHRDVPVMGEVLCVEPDVAFPAADLLPGLGASFGSPGSGSIVRARLGRSHRQSGSQPGEVGVGVLAAGLAYGFAGEQRAGQQDNWQ